MEMNRRHEVNIDDMDEGWEMILMKKDPEAPDGAGEGLGGRQKRCGPLWDQTRKVSGQRVNGTQGRTQRAVRHRKGTYSDTPRPPAR